MTATPPPPAPTPPTRGPTAATGAPFDPRGALDRPPPFPGESAAAPDTEEERFGGVDSAIRAHWQRLRAETADPEPGSVRRPFLLGLISGIVLMLVLSQVMRAFGPPPELPRQAPVLSPQAMVVPISETA